MNGAMFVTSRQLADLAGLEPSHVAKWSHELGLSGPQRGGPERQFLLGEAVAVLARVEIARWRGTGGGARLPDFSRAAAQLRIMPWWTAMQHALAFTSERSELIRSERLGDARRSAWSVVPLRDLVFRVRAVASSPPPHASPPACVAGGGDDGPAGLARSSTGEGEPAEAGPSGDQPTRADPLPAKAPRPAGPERPTRGDRT